jgi:GT2 family glycosyltransferase
MLFRRRATADAAPKPADPAGKRESPARVAFDARGDSEATRPSVPANEAIEFSVVVPTYNRPQHLRQCLEALAALDYPAARCEVIVVDDGSNVGLEAAIAPFFELMNVTVLRQPNSGPATARNSGAAAARGRYLVFTDDDCRPESGWLEALSRSLGDNPGCAVGGRAVNGLPRNLYSTASQLLIDFLYRFLNPDAADAYFLASNNMAFPRYLFLEIDGFDTRFPIAAAEDREICDRWRWLGHRIVYVPDAIIRHDHGLSLSTFLRQHFNYGRGATIFHQIRRARRGSPMPRGWFHSRLLLYPFSQRCDFSPLLLSALLALTQAVMVLGALRQWSTTSIEPIARNSRNLGDGVSVRVVARGEPATRSVR